MKSWCLRRNCRTRSADDGFADEIESGNRVIFLFMARPTTATGEHPFKDKCLFYNFWQDREGALNTPTIQDVAEAEEHLDEALHELVQRGPDAHLRMILRSP